MKLRDYINNSDLQQDYEDVSEAYLLSKKIVDLLKRNKCEEARNLIDKNIEQLYINLDIDSFCCLINYYINNIELKENNLSVLNKPTIPKLLINLYKDDEEKSKIYFINKLNQYNESKSWEYVFQCIDILISKTDVDKLEMYIFKLDLLVKLNRYEDVLKECNYLINRELKTNEYINKTKIKALIETNRYDELEQYLKISEYILDSKTVSNGYIALAKYYELNKKNDKAYKLYTKASELDLSYKIPKTIIYKTKGIEGTKLEKILNIIKSKIDLIKRHKKIKISIMIIIGIILIISLYKGIFNKTESNKGQTQEVSSELSHELDNEQEVNNEDTSKIILTEKNIDELKLDLVLQDNMEEKILEKINYTSDKLIVPENTRLDFKLIDKITGKEVIGEDIWMSTSLFDVNDFGIDPNIYIETGEQGQGDIEINFNGELLLHIDIYVYSEISHDNNNELSEEEKYELIRNRMSSFEPAFAKAINAGDVSLLQDNLLEGEDKTYTKFKNIAEDYYARNIKVVSYDHNVTNIVNKGNDEYKINIYEKWGLIEDGEEEIREYDSIYLLKIQGNECYIKEQIR